MTRTRTLLLVVGGALLLAACGAARGGPDAEARRVGRALAGKPQARNLTCESRSGADLLAAHGIHATEADVFSRLPRSDCRRIE